MDRKKYTMLTLIKRVGVAILISDSRPQSKESYLG